MGIEDQPAQLAQPAQTEQVAQAEPLPDKTVAGDQYTENYKPTPGADGLSPSSSEQIADDAASVKLTFWQRQREPGAPLPIIAAAALAIVIGVAVSTQTTVPQSAIDITGIIGRLWLRALRATVLPLIVTAMIMAIQNIKKISGGKGKRLAWYTIGWYVSTTILAIMHSALLTGLVWGPMMDNVDPEPTDDADLPSSAQDPPTISESVVAIFDSFVPQNVVGAFANDQLLAVLVTAVILGFMLPPRSAIMKAVAEIDTIVTAVITWLILMAPIGVFFLIMPNLFRLDITEIGYNLGILIGGTLVGIFTHLFVVIPLLYLIFTRKNPWMHWLRCSPAWLTAWGSASSAATLPVTLKVARERGVPETIVKFAIPLGCLVNMDGTAIYFPMVVVFLAETQGITLDAAQWIIVCLLATLSSIATTPIPSSSLVLTVMIANSVDVPISEMYAIVVAIDWFLDRFRTALNVSSDLMAAPCIQVLTGIGHDEEDYDIDVSRDAWMHDESAAPAAQPVAQVAPQDASNRV
jgi:Na+/H+-dicarboxylate symporter